MYSLQLNAHGGDLTGEWGLVYTTIKSSHWGGWVILRRSVSRLSCD